MSAEGEPTPTHSERLRQIMDDDDLVYIDDDDDHNHAGSGIGNSHNHMNNTNNNSNNTTNNNNNSNMNGSHFTSPSIMEEPSMQLASERAASSAIADDEAIKARERAMRATAMAGPTGGPALSFQSTTISASSATSTTMASAMATSGPALVAGSMQLAPGLVMASATLPATSAPSPGAVSVGAAAVAPAANATTTATTAELDRASAHQQTDAEIKAQIRASRNTTGAMRVGAVSVSSSRSSAANSVGAMSRGSNTSTMSARSSARAEKLALRDGGRYSGRPGGAPSSAQVGAMSVPGGYESHDGDDNNAARASQVTTEDLAKMSPNSRREHQDAVAKSRARRAARRLNNNGNGAGSASSAMNQRNTSVTSTMSGSVASAFNSTVVSQQPGNAEPSDEYAGVRPVTTSSVNRRTLSRDEMDRQAKLRASQGAASAATPMPPPSYSMKQNADAAATVAPVTTSSMRNSETTQEQRDRHEKMRASAGATGQATMRPGAISVGPMVSDGDADASNGHASPNMKGSAKGAASSFTSRRDRSGRRGGSGAGAGGGSVAMNDDASVMTSSTSVSGARSVSNSQAMALEERARRKVEAASNAIGRGSRHRLQHGSTHSASAASQPDDSHATISAVTTMSTSARPASSSSITSLTMEQQQEKRLQDKLAQMDPQRASASAGGMQAASKNISPKGANAITEAMGYYDKSAPGKPSATSNEAPHDELAHRLNTKMAQLEQQQAENENRAHSSRPEQHSDAQFASLTMKKSHDEEDPLKQDNGDGYGGGAMGAVDGPHVETMGTHGGYNSAMPAGITTTADRGMASAPAVEYGEMQMPMLGDDQLAVAIAIEEDEEETKYLPAAIEYMPDAKPPMYKNRRVQLYTIGGVLTCLTVILLILIVVVFLPSDDSTQSAEKKIDTLSTLPPTQAPTTTKDREIRLVLSRFIGEKVYEEGTPHHQAATWLVEEDPMQLSITSGNFFQRYMLAFFYFSTTNGGTTKWRSCGKADEGEDDTCVFQEIKRDENDNIAFSPVPGRTRWLSGAFECSWQGINCGPNPQSTTAFAIRLFGQNLTGTLPSELAKFPTLQSIALGYNDLRGTLPTEYAAMPYLGNLELHGNMLTGQIPEIYYEADGTLSNFNVGDNMLDGTISTQLGRLTGLKGYHLFQNNFHGPIPTEIGKLRSLAFSRLGFNDFDGNIPTEIGRLTQLNELWLQSTKMEGTIPSEIGRLVRVTDLRIGESPKINGKIPDELFNLNRLTFLLLEANDLTGSLSPLVGRLGLLQALRVSRNRLTGQIPSELGQIFPLRLAWLHLNDMVGSMPTEICEAHDDKPDRFEFLQTDCNPTEDPAIPCECCSACCDRATRLCLLADGDEIDA